ncbi:hypothetical protein [Bacteroides sp. 51]|uniref:hypothetical protein n=1 Tax=Bacteroides sp. 51 TaxID=2302938 RepID=UPI0013D1FDC3|nr:hypothetical protein [Bacteroides sp. 51]NDV82228.1 hypothetical protein [Bacteroides sp. 51]
MEMRKEVRDKIDSWYGYNSANNYMEEIAYMDNMSVPENKRAQFMSEWKGTPARGRYERIQKIINGEEIFTQEEVDKAVDTMLNELY